MTEALSMLRKSNTKKTLVYRVAVAAVIASQFTELKIFELAGRILPLALPAFFGMITMQSRDYAETVKSALSVNEAFRKELKRTHFIYIAAFLLCVVVAVAMLFIMGDYTLLKNLPLAVSVIILHRSESAVLDKIEKSL